MIHRMLIERLFCLSATESPRKTSVFDRLRKMSLTPTKPSATTTPPTTTTSSIMNSVTDWRSQAVDRVSDQSRITAFKSIKDEKSRNVIISLLVFEEFCQELAALCMEHSVAL